MNGGSRMGYAITLLFLEGFIMCGILATYDFTKPHLIDRINDLPVPYSRKYKKDVIQEIQEHLCAMLHYKSYM